MQRAPSLKGRAMSRTSEYGEFFLLIWDRRLDSLRRADRYYPNRSNSVDGKPELEELCTEVIELD
jgi:hypothetical protein